MIGGIISGSFALISDAVNSIGDAFTSVVVLFAFRFAQRPPDAEHPYGHTRPEAIAASNVALLVIPSALGIGWEAIKRIGAQHELPPTWALWIAAANVLVKESLYRYKISVGRRTGSAALVANAWDHRSDALCSLAVLVGLGLMRWGGPGWISADVIAALVIVVAIIWSGVQIFRNSASELMDVQAEDDFVRAVRQEAEAVPDVLGVETLLLRKSGLEYFADIHIEVDPEVVITRGSAMHSKHGTP